jgi:hypothetical protein
MATMFRHTSLVKGVSFNKRTNRWVGRFTLNGQRHYMGTFKEEAEAAQAVNRARINIISSYSLRNEVKDELKWEKCDINSAAPKMSAVQDWNTIPLHQLKEVAKKRGIRNDDVLGDRRIKDNWIDALNEHGARPVTNKEPEINAAIDEIDELITYLEKDEKEDRDFSDAAVLKISEDDWSPCVIIDPKEPAYFWCNSGFLYTLYPVEGCTVWRYDERVVGNYKPIGVWIGPETEVEEEETIVAELQHETADQRPHGSSDLQVALDKEGGSYCKIKLDGPEKEGEILENWIDGALISGPLSQNRNLGSSFSNSGIIPLSPVKKRR